MLQQAHCRAYTRMNIALSASHAGGTASLAKSRRIDCVLARVRQEISMKYSNMHNKSSVTLTPLEHVADLNEFVPPSSGNHRSKYSRLVEVDQ